jgi:hypothetical protein
MKPKFQVADMIVEESRNKGIKVFYGIILDVVVDKELYVYHIVGQEELNMRYNIKFNIAHDRWKKVA